MPDSAALIRALQQAGLRLLVRREHSRQELAQKLQTHWATIPDTTDLAHEVRDECVEAALQLLNDKRWQSDSRFAQQRISQRGQRYGNQRLKQELVQRGVAVDTIESALDEAESELQRCHQVWLKKFGEPATDAVGLAKQHRFLQYRGFSGETIRRVLKNDLSELDN